MMNTLRSGLVIVLSVTLSTVVISPVASADVIKIPIGEQHQELKHISKPERGQSKTLVEQRYGEPVQRYAARGTPPISRWEYPGFVVFFEFDHVIHSVIKHRPNPETPDVLQQDKVVPVEMEPLN